MLLNKKKNYAQMFLIYVFLTIVLVLTIFPIFYTIVSSFKSNSELLAYPERILPHKPTIEAYKMALQTNYNIMLMAWNSVYYTLICVSVTIINSTMSGYAFARGEFPFKRTIFAVFSSLMFISMGSITVYPLFNILNKINLNNSLWGLIVVKAFGISIVNIYLVRGYVRSLPKEIDEAAKIDGCNVVGIFFKVIVPLLKPIIATIGILCFQSSWNEYLMPAIFTWNAPSQRTLIVWVVSLKSSGAAASSWNLMLAGTVVALIPVLFAYALGNRYFISGLASGAVKG